ncbi:MULTISPECIES: VOC family protein [Cryobacterium]|uniref:Putative pterin-4-alpha-carbinolamine dehydratase n=1 Tax=Cryobacterium breve TaxID=1259258 RepID=A0ABY2J9Q5_9MICO|nr:MULTISPECIES: VOC family protein [Cryobacterium]TFC97823.1 4a-hydroxytetrahydrobiopterin dehydratase [Cryobacterium sp. TmT3-12]TFD01571.1 4a-hydroxytetrahydrobiopterin dehydratase [Cryobacterium breve]
MKQPGTLLTAIDTETVLSGGAFVHLDGALHGAFRTTDFASAVRLLDRVTEAADAMNHHPDVRLGYGRVGFRLSSHDAGGVTDRDLRLALRIQDLADTQGADRAPERPTRYDVAIDCTNAAAIRPFWRVGLGYVEVDSEGEVELVHPLGEGPRLWFQTMDIARTERNRIHLDVYVPAGDAESRVQDIISAGGELLTDEHAPDWWVLADAEGNELCVCTTAY